MLNRIVCVLLGHDFNEISEYCGKMENGIPMYKMITVNCSRCGKEPKKKKPDGQASKEKH